MAHFPLLFFSLLSHGTISIGRVLLFLVRLTDQRGEERLDSVDVRTTVPLLILLCLPVSAPVDVDVFAAVLLVRLPPEPHGLVALHRAALGCSLEQRILFTNYSG